MAQSRIHTELRMQYGIRVRRKRVEQVKRMRDRQRAAPRYGGDRCMVEVGVSARKVEDALALGQDSDAGRRRGARQSRSRSSQCMTAVLLPDSRTSCSPRPQSIPGVTRGMPSRSRFRRRAGISEAGLKSRGSAKTTRLASYAWKGQDQVAMNPKYLAMSFRLGRASALAGVGSDERASDPFANPGRKASVSYTYRLAGGRPLRWYDLRHTYGSLLASSANR